VSFRVSFHEPHVQPKQALGRRVDYLWQFLMLRVRETDYGYPKFDTWTLTVPGLKPHANIDGARWEPNGCRSQAWYGMSSTLRGKRLPELMAQARTALAIGPRHRLVVEVSPLFACDISRFLEKSSGCAWGNLPQRGNSARCWMCFLLIIVL